MKPFNYPQLFGEELRLFGNKVYKDRQLWRIMGMRTNKAPTKSGKINGDTTGKSWIDNEAQGCGFKDVRLAKRFNKLLGMMSDGIGESVPYACQDWAIPRRLTDRVPFSGPLRVLV